MDAFETLRERLAALAKQGEGGVGFWPDGLTTEAKALDGMLADAIREAEDERDLAVREAEAEAASWRDARHDAETEFYAHGDRLLELVAAGERDEAVDLIRHIWGSSGAQLPCNAALRLVVELRGADHA